MAYILRDLNRRLKAKHGPAMKRFLCVFYTCVVPFSAHANYTGRYCEIEYAYTENGEQVSGEFYMYSDRYGESDSVYTEYGEIVYGECYRYNEQYCELDNVFTQDGEMVTGECYIY